MCSVVAGLIQVLGITYLNLSVTYVSYVTYFSYIIRDVN